MNLVIKGQFNNEIKTVKKNWEPKNDHVIYPNLPHWRHCMCKILYPLLSTGNPGRVGNLTPLGLRKIKFYG